MGTKTYLFLEIRIRIQNICSMRKMSFWVNTVVLRSWGGHVLRRRASERRPTIEKVINIGRSGEVKRVDGKRVTTQVRQCQLVVAHPHMAIIPS